MIEFFVAGPPRGKARPRVTKKGIAFTPAETRNYEALLRLHAQQAMAGRAPLDGPVILEIVALYPIPASWSKRKRAAALCGEQPLVKPDLDNIAKMADALNGVVWVDDAQVVRLIAEKRYSEQPGIQWIVRRKGEM